MIGGAWDRAAVTRWRALVWGIDRCYLVEVTTVESLAPEFVILRRPREYLDA